VKAPHPKTPFESPKKLDAIHWHAKEIQTDIEASGEFFQTTINQLDPKCRLSQSAKPTLVTKQLF
jgi:hypothetical protein